MKKYKFLSEHCVEEYNKPYVYVEGVQISHPSENTLLIAGIKPLIEEEAPEYDEMTHYLTFYFEDREEGIHRCWRVLDILEGEDLNESSDT